MRRPLAAALVVALLAACGGGGDDGDDPDDAAPEDTTAPTAAGPSTTLPPLPPPAEDPLGGFVPAAIEFDGCGGGMECGSLTVPVDWAQPDGPTIEIAVARIPAGDPDQRIGVLATNPGGPGASGIDFIAGGGVFAGTVLADRFDLVSFDPRGIGRSTPIDCDGAIDDEGGFLRLDPSPDDDAEQAALDRGAAELASVCGADAPELLPHLGTDDVAHDLEAIRRSLGLPLAWFGFSYGTYIGLRYAELFPTGARSIVLDGVVDPSERLIDLLRAQNATFDDVIPAALGDRVEDWERVLAAVEAEPIPTSDGRGLGPAEVITGVILAGYSESFWDDLRDGVDDALDGDGDLLAAMSDEYHDFGDFDAYQAVSCLDSEHPVGAEAWAAFAAELEAVSPHFGAAVANEMLACAFWPVPPQPVNGPVVAEGSPPILVVGTTHDPATPVAQAERVAAGLADGHLLIYDGEGHGAYGVDPCVDEAVEAYLVDGTLPPDGARC